MTFSPCSRLTRSVFCLCLLVPGLGQAQDYNYVIPRITTTPDIDGNVEAAEWQQATVIDVDIEFQPGDAIEAAVGARGLLMEDGEVLYVAFIADDPDPDQIRA